jgi:hypothetical protein
VQNLIFETEGSKNWQWVETQPSKAHAEVREVQNGEINKDARQFKYVPITGREARGGAVG